MCVPGLSEVRDLWGSLQPPQINKTAHRKVCLFWATFQFNKEKCHFKESNVGGEGGGRGHQDGEYM